LKEPSPSTLWSLWATWKVVHQARHIPHQLPLSQAWGVGCSPRPMAGAFPSRARPAMPAACPRLWAMAMGVTFYSWSSDQLSQYGTRFVPVTVRDSTYVLDEICTNETELPIREHTTDTAGAAGIIFAHFDLLGFRFAPRLRNLNEPRLFASGPVDMQQYSRLQSQVTGRINRPGILDCWDELLRVAGSMKLGIEPLQLLSLAQALKGLVDGDARQPGSRGIAA
jgi:TnpA family transposase